MVASASDPQAPAELQPLVCLRLMCNDGDCFRGPVQWELDVDLYMDILYGAGLLTTRATVLSLSFYSFLFFSFLFSH